MKNLKTLTLALFTLTASYAADITAVSSGAWSATSTWSTNVLPATSDLVIIPAGITVTIDDVQQYSASSLTINVFGTLRLVSPGKIDLDATSIINVYSGGKITGNGSPSETIKIGGTRKFVGTEADIVGPKMANMASGTGFVGFGTLPVKFVSYSVVKNGNDYQLVWATAEELNSHYFEVERSEDGMNWKALARIQAAGNSSSVKEYVFTDRNVTMKTLHYRIKQADQDGRVTYTVVKSFRNNNNASIAITARPNQVVIHFAEQIRGTVEIQVVSITGQVIALKKVTDPKGQLLITTGSLKGQHVITVRNSQELAAARQVIL
jgi:hypothetical protein